MRQQGVGGLITQPRPLLTARASGGAIFLVYLVTTQPNRGLPMLTERRFLAVWMAVCPLPKRRDRWRVGVRVWDRMEPLRFAIFVVRRPVLGFSAIRVRLMTQTQLEAMLRRERHTLRA